MDVICKSMLGLNRGYLQETFGGELPTIDE